MASKETICSRCQHSQVCKYKDGLIELIVKTNNLISYHKDYMFGSLDLHCKHFLEVEAMMEEK